MTLQDQTLCIHLDPDAKKRLDKASSLAHLSPASFVEQAADERARDMLLDWAVRSYRQGDTTYSLLAEETGLGIVEIMYAMGDDGLDEALDSFLARAATLADERDNPDLLRLARNVAAQVREEARQRRRWSNHS